jgi:glyoxylase-like metal-dependent hydrolase (beta-lactamase superfamily II)
VTEAPEAGTAADVPVAEVPVAGAPRQVTARATWLLAPNPGPMTFDGTNSWVLHEPGRRGAVVLDPGPADSGHLDALVDLAVAAGGEVTAILLSHGHFDHSQAVPELARRTGAPVYAAAPQWADRVIDSPQTLDLAGLRVEALPTPGHSGDSLTFLLPDDGSLLTGDTVLGRSAPIMLDVGQMIGSLRALRSLVNDGQVVLPGHGPIVAEPAPLLDLALAARAARLVQIEEAVGDGCQSVSAIADRLYGSFDERIRRPIEASVLAHVRYLRETGRISWAEP